MTIALRFSCYALTAIAFMGCGDRAAPKLVVALPIKVGEVSGLSVPESARYDAARDVWYISNINGVPSEEDGSGFITRVRGDLSVVDTTFIAGGRDGVELNAPKGMTVAGDTLWVADINAVRGFDVRSGAPVATIDVAGAVFLNDITRGTDGALYITDTGIKISATGMSHPGPDRVFRIAGREVSEALRFENSPGPNGITMDDDTGRMLIVPFANSAIYAWTIGSATADSIAYGPGGYDGVVVLADGRVLISSWTDSTVHVIAGDSLVPFIRGLPTPADMGVDTTRGRLGIPLFELGRVEFWTIPAR